MSRSTPSTPFAPALRLFAGSLLLLAAAVLGGLAAVASPVRAEGEDVPLDTLFARATTPGALRAQLASWAEERATTDVEASGEALYWIGESFARAGQRDSAIAAWERAWSRRRGGPEVDGLTEALIARRGPDDLDRARTLLIARLPGARANSETDVANTNGRIAWLHTLRGKPDSAVTLFTRYERRLLEPINSMRWIWQVRMARAELANGNSRRALDLATPVAARNLLKDFDALDLVSDATPGGANRAAPLIRNELRLLIEERRSVITAMDGREVAFPSVDGEALTGVVVAPRGKGAARAAVAFVGRDESFEAWDSLTAKLRSAGIAVILVEPRGTGGSRTKEFPSPESWSGHEDALESQLGRETKNALRALALATPIDTTRYLVIAAGTLVGSAIEAAKLDPRVVTLFLTSPDPSPLVRGQALATLRSLRLPIFIENASTDLNLYFMNVSDLFLHAADEGASRSADSRHMGPGVVVYRNDIEAFPRFKKWLDETWAKPRRSATPPRAPRKG